MTPPNTRSVLNTELKNIRNLFSLFSTVLISSRPRFWLFHALNLSPTFIFANSIYRWLKVVVAFLLGDKFFDLHFVPRSHHVYVLDLHDILLFPEPHYRWELHDILFPASRIFRRFTIFYYFHELLSISWRDNARFSGLAGRR